MDKNVYFGLALFFLLLPLTFSAPAEANSGAGLIPRPISQYYEDYSFVSSFSTPQERTELAAYLRMPGLPDRYKNGRLKKVFELMKKLRAQIINIDPKITIDPSHKMEHVDYVGLIKVKGVKLSGDRASVDVLFYGLRPEANLWLIAEYEKSGGDETKIPSPEQRLARAGASTFQRAETHNWAKINGEWKKNELNIIPLK
jgi:hypothetical protein